MPTRDPITQVNLSVSNFGPFEAAASASIRSYFAKSSLLTKSGQPAVAGFKVNKQDTAVFAAPLANTTTSTSSGDLVQPIVATPLGLPAAEGDTADAADKMSSEINQAANDSGGSHRHKRARLHEPLPPTSSNSTVSAADVSNGHQQADMSHQQVDNEQGKPVVGGAEATASAAPLVQDGSMGGQLRNDDGDSVAVHHTPCNVSLNDQPPVDDAGTKPRQDAQQQQQAHQQQAQQGRVSATFYEQQQQQQQQQPAAAPSVLPGPPVLLSQLVLGIADPSQTADTAEADLKQWLQGHRLQPLVFAHDTV
eukprot:jgi/Chrzof1/11608/Cz06g02040.t1